MWVMFDAAFSMFGLMIFPDRNKGFAEIYRTLKPGGSIAVSSWAPLDQSPAMQMMFGALKAIKPDLPEPQRAVTTLENPDVFKQELLNAGFRDMKIQCITKAAFPVESIAVFWGDMVKGSAPNILWQVQSACVAAFNGTRPKYIVGIPVHLVYGAVRSSEPNQ